jgi:hypothetical protein
MSGGFTVDPAVYIDENGQEQINFDDAVIRQPFQGEHRFDYNDYTYDSRSDSFRHRYTDIDGEELENRLDRTYETDEPNSLYIEGLKELAGGEDAYANMIAWAAQSLPPDAINWFDGQIDTDDPEAMEAAVLWLLEQYQESGNYDESEDYDDDGSYMYYDDGSIKEEVRDYVVDQVVGGAENYFALVDWAADNLSEEMIDQYDDIMDSGDTQAIMNAMGRLLEIYQENA